MNASERIDAAIARADAQIQRNRRDVGYRIAREGGEAADLQAVEDLRATISHMMLTQFGMLPE